MRIIILSLFTLLFISCSNNNPQDIEQQVDKFIANDNYSEAIELLNETDSTKTEADLPTLKEKTHLNYGLYLEYRGPEEASMRERMIEALKQYIAVLKLNPENQQARDEINQIMSIYGTMQDRSPGEEVLNELRELDFDY